MIKFRRLKWAKHVTRMEDNANTFKNLTGKPAEKRHLKTGLGIDREGRTV